MSPLRPQFPALGCHLARSVLRICLSPEDLQEVLPHPAMHAPRAHRLRVAEELLVGGGPPAEAIMAALDRRHGAMLSNFLAAGDREQLKERWSAAMRGEESLAGAYWAILTHPLADRAIRDLAFADVEMRMPEPGACDPGTLEDLIERRSVSPRRLGFPAPRASQIDQMIQAALSAPDHGRLHPWRVLEFVQAQREALADLFEAEKLRREPLALHSELRRAREHATRSPCLLGFIVSPRLRKRVPAREQWLAAGAALGNLLNAAHRLGFGAIVLSGERCFDEVLMRELGLASGEQLVGFISVGTIVEATPSASRPLPGEVWGRWSPSAAGRRETRGPSSAMLREFGVRGLD